MDAWRCGAASGQGAAGLAEPGPCGDPQEYLQRSLQDWVERLDAPYPEALRAWLRGLGVPGKARRAAPAGPPAAAELGSPCQAFAPGAAIQPARPPFRAQVGCCSATTLEP